MVSFEVVSCRAIEKKWRRPGGGRDSSSAAVVDVLAETMLRCSERSCAVNVDSGVVAGAADVDTDVDVDVNVLSPSRSFSRSLSPSFSFSSPSGFFLLQQIEKTEQIDRENRHKSENKCRHHIASRKHSAGYVTCFINGWPIPPINMIVAIPMAPASRKFS